MCAFSAVTVPARRYKIIHIVYGRISEPFYPVPCHPASFGCIYGDKMVYGYILFRESPATIYASVFAVRRRVCLEICFSVCRVPCIAEGDLLDLTLLFSELPYEPVFCRICFIDRFFISDCISVFGKTVTFFRELSPLSHKYVFPA